MLTELLFNAALLVALTALYGLLAWFRHVDVVRAKVFAGLLFGGVAIAGMNAPLHYAPGIIYDGRSIVLTMAGLFGGGRASVLSAVIAAAYRAHIGGAGVYAGVATIVVCPLVGLAFRRAFDNRPEALGPLGLYGVGIAAHIAMLACQLLLPWPDALDVLKHISTPVMLVFPAGTLLMGLLLGNVEHAIRSEREQKESERRFRELFEKVNLIAVILDKAGRVTFCNDFLLAVTGWSREELIGADWFDRFLSKSQRESVRKMFFESLESDHIAPHYQNPIVTRSGEERLILWNNILLRDREGAATGTASLGLDITTRRRAEAERERLLSAVEQAGDIIVITDAEGAIEYVNPAFTHVTGYAAEEALGQNPRILKSGRQDNAFYRHLWQTVSAGKTWQGRFINRKKDGTLYTEEATISPVRDEDGQIVNYVAVKRDITHALELEERLNQAQRMQSIGRLAGGVAHDFNNILTGIKGYLRFAMMKTAPGSKIHEDLAQTEALADRAADLTRQLLAFSRRQTLEMVVLNVNDLIANQLKMVRRLLGEDIDILFVPAGDLDNIRADPGQIEQVIMNLAVNARDAMPEGGRLTIETANATLSEEYADQRPGAAPGPHVLISVSDTGCGMDKETRDHIFDPFFTTKDPGRGTGLGLATVYGIVKQHTGNVWVYSEPGEGTTFKVYLPSATEKTTESKRTHPRIVGGSETILVVEDEAAVRDVTRRLLERFGYRVLVASDPREAEKIAAADPRIDLLLTDVVLPGRSGRVLYELLAAEWPDLRVLYMSGYTDNAISHRGVLDEGTPFLHKPFAAEALAAKVREVLDG